MYNSDIKDYYALFDGFLFRKGKGYMRSQGKHVKKKKQGWSFFAKFILVMWILVALFLGGFVLWVFYGEEGDGRAENTPGNTAESEKKVESVTIDVSKNWSVTDKAFKGSNGYGKFVSKNVKNKVSLSKILSEMGIDENTKDKGEKNRIETVKMFLDGLYYESDKTENLSNGDEIEVYIRSTEDPEEIENSADVIINGIGEHKKVTVSGLTEKFSYGELAGRQDLLEAMVEAGKKAVKESDAGHHKEIFGDEKKYETEFTLYGLYFAQPQDRSADDHMVLIYRLKSKYPDDKYAYWSKEGDWVFTYEMVHCENVNKETTVDDIKKNTKYDSFRYQDKASEIFQWYKDNLDKDTTYYLQQMSYQG